MKNYKKRIADNILVRKLEGKGAVLIEGPKWCGKTTTAEQIAKSILYMSEPSRMNQNLQMAKLNPLLLLQGDKPRLIDEWQLAPTLWDTVRFDVDHANRLGQYILTGSAVPADMTEVVHTGTGRFAWLRMRTMSLFESGESNFNMNEGIYRSPHNDETNATNDNPTMHRALYIVNRKKINFFYSNSCIYQKLVVPLQSKTL